MALFGGDALGMELHAMHGMRLVLQAHDDAVVRLGRDLEAIGQGRALDDQRMIARDLERFGRPLNTPLPVLVMVDSLPCIGCGARITLPP